MVVFYDVQFPASSSAIISSTQSLRYGIEAVNATSVIVGHQVKIWTVRLRRTAGASGNITATIRRASDDAIVTSFNEILDSTTLSLTPTFSTYVFTLNTLYTIQAGDRLQIEYSGPNQIDIEVWSIDRINGGNTRRTRYDGVSYFGGNTNDIPGTIDDGIKPLGSGNPALIPQIQVTRIDQKMFGF